MDGDVLRNTVGVRNPFSLAEAKLGKKIDWCNTSADKKRALIEKAFGVSYREIFDPHNTDPSLIHPVRSGSGDASQCDAVVIKDLISGWGKNPLGTIYCDPQGSYGTFNDPVQGALADCYFMAALSSIAFAGATRKKFFFDMSGPSYTLMFWYNFVTANGVSSPQSFKNVTVKSDHLPLGRNDRLVFARSNTPAEIWPAVYEKGFAQFRSGVLLNEPDYSKLCQGNPITALANITGYNYSMDSVFATRTFATCPAAIYSKIAEACSVAPPTRPNDRAAYWPIVAYTYDSSLMGYSNAALVRNHSYSVLGVQKTDTDYYIVLRNPWGQVPPPVIMDPALMKERCILDAQGNPVVCFGDPVLDATMISKNSWLGITDLSDPDDGIFGLNVKAFQKYFQGFGWVFS